MTSVKTRQMSLGLLPEASLEGFLSGRRGGAPLQQEGVTHVTHPNGSRVGGQGQLVTGAVVAVDVPAVSTMVLQHAKTNGSLTTPSQRRFL